MKKSPAFMKDKEGKMLPPDEDGNFKYYKDPEGNVAYKDEHVKVDGHLEYATTIRFSRYFKEMDKTISSDYSFYWSDAVKAKWTSKD